MVSNLLLSLIAIKIFVVIALIMIIYFLKKKKQPTPLKVKVNIMDAILSKLGLYTLLTIVVYAIFLISLKEAGAFPFGAYSIANYDYLAQTAPFMEHFYDVLSGNTSLFYSFNVMGGADMFQSLMFMMLSPFTPLFLLLGRTNTIYTISLVLPLKISAIGWSVIYYIRKRFPNIGSIATFTIAIIYSYCGYAVTANTYINWMDFLIYLPLVALGFKRLVETGSVRLHAIASACLIYTCFSIASFSYFLIFPIYFIYVFTAVDKDKRKQVATNIIISTIYTVLLALPLLIPCLISSASSSRNTSLFANLEQDISIGIKNAYVKLTYIVSDTFLVIFGLIYIIKNRHSKMGKFLLLSGVVIMFPVVVDEACYLLNAGSYNSYALRFGFLNAFYAMFSCCMCLEKVDFKEFFHKEVLSENKPVILNPQSTCANGNAMSVKNAFLDFPIIKFIRRNYKNKKFILSILATAIFTTVTAFLSYCLWGLYDKSTKLHVNDMRSGDFASQFAHSEGGFSVVIWVFAFAVVLSSFAYLLYKHKLVTAKVISCVLAIFAVSQSSFYIGSTVDGNLFDPIRYDTYEAYIEALKEDDSDFGYYRVKDYKEYVNNNVSLIYGTRALTVFSSNMDVDSFKTTNYFHYTTMSDGINNATSKGKDLFGDCLLGYKYWYMFKNDADDRNFNYDNKEGDNSPVFRDYLKAIDMGELDDDSEFTMYENLYAFPSAFWTTSDTPLNMTGEDYCKDLDELYHFLGGQEKSLFEIHYLDSGNISKYVGTNYYTVRMTQNWTGSYYLHLDTEAQLEGIEQKTVYRGYSVDQGKYWSINIPITEGEIESKEDVLKKCKIYLLPTNRMEELYNLIMDNNRVIRYSQSNKGVMFDIENIPANAYAVVSNVLLDGHKLTVNGKKASFIDNPTGLMVFKLAEGDNSVAIKYTSPYPIIALVVAVICVLLIIGLTLIRRKTRLLKKNITQSTLYFGGIILSLILVGFFLIYPLTIFIEKAFMNIQIGRIIG